MVRIQTGDELWCRQTDNTHANNSWTWVAKDTRTCAFTIYFLSVSISPSVSQSLKVNSRVSVSKNCMKRGQVRVICMKCTVSTPKGITFNWSICCVNIKPYWSVCCMWCQFSWLIYKLARSGINPSRDHLTKNVVDTGGFGGRGRYLKKKKKSININQWFSACLVGLPSRYYFLGNWLEWYRLLFFFFFCLMKGVGELLKRSFVVSSAWATRPTSHT